LILPQLDFSTTGGAGSSDGAADWALAVLRTGSMARTSSNSNFLNIVCLTFCLEMDCWCVDKNSALQCVLDGITSSATWREALYVADL
jgi:hypothetical protein